MRRAIRILVSLCLILAFANLFFLHKVVSSHIVDTDNNVLQIEESNGIVKGDATSWPKKEIANHNVKKDLTKVSKPLREVDPVNPVKVPKMKYNATEYQLLLDKSMNPRIHITNTVNSTAWLFRNPWAGLCNQYMMFIGAIFVSAENRHGQIIEETIQWKDTYGHEQYLQHQKLFDILHWNSFYPQLPRIVRYDKDIHPDIKVRGTNVKIEGKWYSKAAFVQSTVGDREQTFRLATNPVPIWENQNEMFRQYKHFMKELDNGHDAPLSVEKTGIYKNIMNGAFRPHPEIQVMIDRFIDENIKTKEEDRGFMVLHARIEPDMQNHPVCKDKKVKNVTDIIESLYKYFPEPPVSSVVMVFNRDLLEALVSEDITPTMNANKELRESFEDDSVRKLTIHNLRAINDYVEKGLWGGRVRVVEAGSKLVQQVSTDSWYRHYSNLVGGILNFFLAIQSDIFVGTEVSSYSTLVSNSRFYRTSRGSYFYRSTGLHPATPVNATKPHRFAC